MGCPRRSRRRRGWQFFFKYHIFLSTDLTFPPTTATRYDAVSAMRAMERYTRDCGGYPFLYADIFMDRKEFEQMFNLTGEKRLKLLPN